jgi:hypothetical protein
MDNNVQQAIAATPGVMAAVQRWKDVDVSGVTKNVAVSHITKYCNGLGMGDQHIKVVVDNLNLDNKCLRSQTACA